MCVLPSVFAYMDFLVSATLAGQLRPIALDGSVPGLVGCRQGLDAKHHIFKRDKDTDSEKAWSLCDAEQGMADPALWSWCFRKHHKLKEGVTSQAKAIGPHLGYGEP